MRPNRPGRMPAATPNWYGMTTSAALWGIWLGRCCWRSRSRRRPRWITWPRWSGGCGTWLRRGRMGRLWTSSASTTPSCACWRTASRSATGFTDLDRITCGFQPSQLVIVAARPGQGKTAFALSVARHMAMREGAGVFFASLEQSAGEVAQRLVSGLARVDSRLLRQGRLNRDEAGRVFDATKRLRTLPIHIADACNQTALQITANARRLVRKHGIRCVIVDYLQLVEPEDRLAKRYEQVGAVSRRLKQLARDLCLPVIALAQLGRGVEERKGRPRLSDLRESGNIEADADTVLLMHRPDDLDAECVAVEVDVAKHRNGPTGSLTLAFQRPYVTFENHGGPEPVWR